MRPNSFFSIVFRRHWHAFTLIELLIVVAIIAILAAIAVPNFLNAQVRAKTARAQADMRTITVGITSYMVDYNGQPPLVTTIYDTGFPIKLSDTNYARVQEVVVGHIWGTTSTGLVMCTAPLTTPVAYLATAKLLDPFARDGIKQLMGSSYFYRQGLVGYGLFVIKGAGKYLLSTQAGKNELAASSDTVLKGIPALDPGLIWINGKRQNASFMLVSMGPDSLYNWGYTLTGSEAEKGNCWHQSFGMWRLADNFALGDKCKSIPSDYFKMGHMSTQYDPTNGTTSYGDIIRFGS